MGTKIKDSGTYTCRATNKVGKAELSVQLECVDKSAGQKPRFTTQIQNLEGLKDGQSAHYECTLVPVGDPDMKVEWFHNGQPMRHSTRIKPVSDFGYVLLDIAYVQSHDSGEYVCKASNKYGEDTTTATLKCFGKGGVFFDSLQPDSLARIKELESMGHGVPQSPGSQPVPQWRPIPENPFQPRQEIGGLIKESVGNIDRNTPSNLNEGRPLPGVPRDPRCIVICSPAPADACSPDGGRCKQWCGPTFSPWERP